MEGENKLPAVGVAGPHVGQQWSSEWTTVIPGPHCGSSHCTCWEGQAYTNIQHEMIVWRREEKGNREKGGKEREEGRGRGRRGREGRSKEREGI